MNWYTPNFSNAHDQGLVADEDTGGNIAIVYDKANAALIAAAPDMLKALMKTQTILAQYRDDQIPKGYTLEEFKYLCIAPVIDQATGEV